MTPQPTDNDRVSSIDDIAEAAGLVTDQARTAQLATGTAISPTTLKAGGSPLVLVVLLVAAVAFPVRLLTWPLRKKLQPRERDGERRRVAHRRKTKTLMAQCDRLTAAPDDLPVRFARGVNLLALDYSGQAELDFDVCVAALDGGAVSEVALASAVFNRARARKKLGLVDLASADFSRARRLGLRAPPLSGVRARLQATWAMFLFMAGWA